MTLAICSWFLCSVGMGNSAEQHLFCLGLCGFAWLEVLGRVWRSGVGCCCCLVLNGLALSRNDGRFVGKGVMRWQKLPGAGS